MSEPNDTPTIASGEFDPNNNVVRLEQAGYVGSEPDWTKPLRDAMKQAHLLRNEHVAVPADWYAHLQAMQPVLREVLAAMEHQPREDWYQAVRAALLPLDVK